MEQTPLRNIQRTRAYHLPQLREPTEMRGKKCPACEHFTMFLMSTYLKCSECGLQLCKIWEIECPHNYNETHCDDCWRGRLSAKSQGG